MDPPSKITSQLSKYLTTFSVYLVSFSRGGSGEWKASCDKMCAKMRIPFRQGFHGMQLLALIISQGKERSKIRVSMSTNVSVLSAVSITYLMEMKGRFVMFNCVPGIRAHLP